jgi:hypothetical protein
MEYNEMAAKRRKKRKTYCLYAPFASFRGYSLSPLCSLCCGLMSKPGNRTGLNAETQRNAEKRKEKDLSASLCESLRLCVNPSP